MFPDGRLYVRDLFNDSDPGAQSVIPSIKKAVAWMRANCQFVVFTGDWHGMEDPEIDAVAPDPAKGTYPPHCMGRSTDPHESKGAEIIESIRPADPTILDHDASVEEGRRIARNAVRTRRSIFIRKTRFDVFEGNPATSGFVEEIERALGRAPCFVVVGVARDVCVTQAVDGLQERGYSVVSVRDATWGLGLEAEADTLARWARKGRILTIAELESGVNGSS